MRSAPSISVLIPVFNGQKYLSEAIESILAQTFGDFELLVLDDGSSDQSREIAGRAVDKRVRLRALPHEGLVSTLNAGLREARGELIARMDADDVAMPDRFQKQVAFLQAHPDVVALGTAARVIDGAGRRTGSIVPPATHAALMRNLLFERIGPSLLHPSVMMRTAATRQCGGYRKEFVGCEDGDLWLRFARTGQLHCLPDQLLALRMHGANVTMHLGHEGLKGHITGIACHLVWLQTGVDLIDHAAGLWHRARTMVDRLADERRLPEIVDLRGQLGKRLKQRSLGGLTAGAGFVLRHPQVLLTRRIEKLFRGIADDVARAMIEQVRAPHH